MAFDSATAVQQASDAYKRALAVAQQKRTALNTGYGLTSEGALDPSAAGRLGSIYQTGLAGEQGYEQAAAADRVRGHGVGTGGLLNRNTVRARQQGLDNQARAFGDAATQLGAVTGEEQLAGQDYRDQVGADGLGGTIGKQAAWDLAQTLAANPVLGSAPSQASPIGISPAQAAVNRRALQRNPRAAQVARNNRF